MITEFNFIKLGTLSPILLMYSIQVSIILTISPIWHRFDWRSVIVWHACTIIAHLLKSPPSLLDIFSIVPTCVPSFLRLYGFTPLLEDLYGFVIFLTVAR